jgi:drug/metabolite transporter (DMT)-like permease
MRKTNNATDSERVTRAPAGLLLGAVGVVAFSGSLVATRAAVLGLDAWFVAFGRAVVAGLLGAAVLAATRGPLPRRRHLPSLALVGLGVVVGFPLFSSLALEDRTSAHGAVVVGLLPVATALFAVARAGERPTPRFWLASAAGLVAVLAFAAAAGAGGPQPSDALLLAAVGLGGLGYAEGGALSRELGGWRTICWALVLSLPVTVPVAALAAATGDVAGGPGAWAGFAYVSLVSMFLGFFAWYAGLALGGVAKVGQVQLAQPVLTLAWAALLLGERVTAAMGAAALAVLASVVATQRARVARSGLAGTAGAGARRAWEREERRSEQGPAAGAASPPPSAG